MAHPDCRGAYRLIAQQKQCRQQEYDAQHTHQGAACHQHTHGADDINVRIDSHTEGGGEQSQSRNNDRRDGGCQSRDHAVVLAVAPDAFRLVAGCHQDGVVHRGTQLNRADADGGDEGQRLPEIVRQTEVDEDSQLDDSNQDEGEQCALLHQGDDDKDGNDGDGIDHLEVTVGGVYHILHAGCLADQHTGGIILLQDAVQAGDLLIDRVAGDLVLGVDQQQLPAVALEDAPDAVRQDLLRHPRADDGFQSEDVLDAVHLLHLVHHGADIAGRHLCIHQHHVRGGNVELLRQLGVGDDVFHIPTMKPLSD